MPLIGCFTINFLRMKKSHLAISILTLFISLVACKSSINESATIVSPEGNVLREITDPEDSITQNWVYDVNDGAYRMEHTAGTGSGQIVITDRKGRLCAAYGYNQCQPQIAKVCYEDDRLSKLILIWEDDKVDLMPDGTYRNTSWIGDDVGKMFDKLLKGEVTLNGRGTFNKSHAVCYTWIAYQMGYLKGHYPEVFTKVMDANGS